MTRTTSATSGSGTEAADQWSVEVESASLRYRLFAGPAPLDALRRFTAATGRQPEPARWFFGPWYQSGHANHVPLEEEERQVEVLRGSPASAVETHCRYLPLGEDRGHGDEERARTEFFHSQGLAALSYINPLVGRDYPEAFDAAASAGALQKDGYGSPYVFRAYAGGRVPPHTDEVQYDFTNPEAVRCWGDIAARLIAAGYDGWMEDFGEYTPLDAFASDGTTGTAAHNRYPTQYHMAAAQVAAELEARHGRRLAASSGPAGRAVPLPPRSCGAAIRRRRGVSTVWPALWSRGCPWEPAAWPCGAATPAGSCRPRTGSPLSCSDVGSSSRRSAP